MIYVLGSGAIGFPLAAYLANAGRAVVAVRTSRDDIARSTVEINVKNGTSRLSVPVETISLTKLNTLDGVIVLAAKSHANTEIARLLRGRVPRGPVVIMQNGIGVEQPFLNANCSPVYRCVLYATSQAVSEHEFTVNPITPSPIGIIEGDWPGLKKCVEDLTTDGLPFCTEADIQREIWKKAVINSVFNSICPLLDVDNGVFVRDAMAADLARQLIAECVMLTDRLGLRMSEGELMGQVMLISRGSSQLISTLQDIRNGRQTEMESLNLEIARIAASLQPALQLPKIHLLGRMVLAKSAQWRTKKP
jgi:2-dehydropantoate 2-reductase